MSWCQWGNNSIWSSRWNTPERTVWTFWNTYQNYFRQSQRNTCKPSGSRFLAEMKHWCKIFLKTARIILITLVNEKGITNVFVVFVTIFYFNILETYVRVMSGVWILVGSCLSSIFWILFQRILFKLGLPSPITFL